MDQDEQLLLAVLNSAPVLDGHRHDHLDGAEGAALVRAWGGTGTTEERVTLRRTREALHAVIREADTAALEVLGSVVADAAKTPRVTLDGLSWELQTPADTQLAVRTVTAWSDVARRFPGRVRACANPECNLFLVDHSRPGTAKWCSMAACGNRAKARAFAARARAEAHPHDDTSADATNH
ncbi:CGNR zinc finger domain-containing protein [Curtobacterium flaccumfaciens pv. flaccumfaciens]|uniref:CGNR zinc finger domain-containing protein n=1 Tax=Curtobacterium flaccumfaciens TaxID=2035 RepID=UPI00217F036C|nr:CGNR zinc finger domain-containing protein [Curtobacterium flaccumfaciens]MCS6586953.1 CGNR zinc finger domain-containing protein [Curtobacterium flaccumfaciens pv. flaccumfaciens]